jgi:hypothetical protein
MPAGIDSPGYVEEQRKKPRITKKIEEDDVVLSAESVAKSLIIGEYRLSSWGCIQGRASQAGSADRDYLKTKGG